MFSLLSVCLSTGGMGSSCDHYPWCIRPHCTRPSPPHTHTSWLQPPWKSDMLLCPNIRHGTPPQPWSCPLVLIYDGHHWRPVQTCSFVDLPLGVPEMRAPLGVQILSLSCSFRPREYVRTPTLGVGASTLRKILDQPLESTYGLQVDITHLTRMLYC